MSDGYPSLTALLGLVAIAGYQNKDKIAEWFGGGKDEPAAAGQPGAQGRDQSPGALGGLLQSLGGAGGGANAGSFLNSGLGEMLERFQANGHGAAAQSWVNQGPNQPIASQQLEQAIGPNVLDALAQRTGLSRDELLSRLSRNLPEAIDRYTPDGRVPAH